MNVFIPSSLPWMMENAVSSESEYFGATLFVVTLSLCCCVYLLWNHSGKRGDWKEIILYLVTLFYLLLLFALVSFRDEQNDYCNDCEKSDADYEVIVRGDRILVFEHFSF